MIQTPKMETFSKKIKTSITPLWVISALLGLCEVVTGVVGTQVTGNIQLMLTIFVVVFPVLIAVAFFTILWIKPYVFYPPGDFEKETNVSEYVRALGGPSPVEAAEKQRQLIGKSDETSSTLSSSPNNQEISTTVPQDEEANKKKTELALTIFNYFGFKRMRYSDVSDDISRAIFNLGAHHGFNLFDGIQGITFFGLFSDFDFTEIVTRVRFLFNNIALAYERVKEHPDEAQREIAQKYLDQIQIEILLPENAPEEDIKLKIEEYRPSGIDVPLILSKPSILKTTVQNEYENMGIESLK